MLLILLTAIHCIRLTLSAEDGSINISRPVSPPFEEQFSRIRGLQIEDVKWLMGYGQDPFHGGNKRFSTFVIMLFPNNILMDLRSNYQLSSNAQCQEFSYFIEESYHRLMSILDNPNDNEIIIHNTAEFAKLLVNLINKNGLEDSVYILSSALNLDIPEMFRSYFNFVTNGQNNDNDQPIQIQIRHSGSSREELLQVLSDDKINVQGYTGNYHSEQNVMNTMWNLYVIDDKLLETENKMIGRIESIGGSYSSKSIRFGKDASFVDLFKGKGPWTHIIMHKLKNDKNKVRFESFQWKHFFMGITNDLVSDTFSGDASNNKRCFFGIYVPDETINKIPMNIAVYLLKCALNRNQAIMPIPTELLDDDVDQMFDVSKYKGFTPIQFSHHSPRQIPQPQPQPPQPEQQQPEHKQQPNQDNTGTDPFDAILSGVLDQTFGPSGDDSGSASGMEVDSKSEEHDHEPSLDHDQDEQQPAADDHDSQDADDVDIDFDLLGFGSIKHYALNNFVGINERSKDDIIPSITANLLHCKSEKLGENVAWIIHILDNENDNIKKYDLHSIYVRLENVLGGQSIRFIDNGNNIDVNGGDLGWTHLKLHYNNNDKMYKFESNEWPNRYLCVDSDLNIVSSQGNKPCGTDFVVKDKQLNTLFKQ